MQAERAIDPASPDAARAFPMAREQGAPSEPRHVHEGEFAPDLDPALRVSQDDASAFGVDGDRGGTKPGSVCRRPSVPDV